MSVIDIATLKSAIKAQLDDNNTSTGAPIRDLSSNMSKRVVRVALMNPIDYQIVTTEMPAVCIYTDTKIPKNTSVGAVNQTKREGMLRLTVCALNYNPNMAGANVYNDVASQDLEYLMENIEEILRQSPEISGAKWLQMGEITFHNSPADEDTYFKLAFTDLTYKYFY
ncbi:MAG: hypothetical protein C4586_05910 [Anaerolineaceae bacterium]|nr:MAG: hypothetical protein C4586_05910 [Anaerolineaceae bacterium]